MLELEKDFGEVDFSFILPRGEVNYLRFSSVDEFSEAFFSRIENDGLSSCLQILVGESAIKYCDRKIIPTAILVVFVSDIDGKLKYDFMGVIE